MQFKLSKSYFSKHELLSLVTSNFYSILFYNSEIWHLPSVKPTLKQKLLSASAKALETCIKHVDPMTSFDNIHTMCNRATPNQIMKYKLACSSCIMATSTQLNFTCSITIK